MEDHRSGPESSDADVQSIADRLREGMLDDASGLSDETRDVLAAASWNVSECSDEVAGAVLFADTAVHTWLGEVIEACEGPDDLVGELDHLASFTDGDSARAASQRVLMVQARLDTVLEKAAAHHAAQAADAAAATLDRGDADAAHTAAHNAGRVLGELAVAGQPDRAVELFRTAVAAASQG